MPSHSKDSGLLSVLLYGGTVLSLDAGGKVLRQGEILAQRGLIASVGRSLTLMPRTRLLDVTGKLVVPGFVETRPRLASLDADPGERDRLDAGHDEESAYRCGLAAALSALLAGVTAVRDASPRGVAAAAVARALEECGLFAVSASAPGEGPDPDDDALGLAALARQISGGAPGHQALEAKTRRAAEALGLEDQVGSLEVGKRADVVVLDPPDEPGLLSGPDEGIYDAVARSTVEHVLVGGLSMVDNGHLVHHDLARARADAETERRRVLGA